MNTILYMRINPYHLRPQLRVLPHKDLRIPSSGDEERIDPLAIGVRKIWHTCSPMRNANAMMTGVKVPPEL
jgi:hypothetical protein